MLELVVVVAIIFVLLGVGLPFFTQSYRDYQLNDAATQVAGILKAARFDAIRRNVAVNCVINQGGNPSVTNMWVDPDADGVEQNTEQQILLRGTLTMVPGGAVPATGALAAAVGVPVLTAINPAATTLTFDFRGAVNPPAVYAFYINDLAPNAGFRAVILLPSGSIQVWAASAVGGWRQVS
jgi:Tfp pilus assembly protein FimT